MSRRADVKYFHQKGMFVGEGGEDIWGKGKDKTDIKKKRHPIIQ